MVVLTALCAFCFVSNTTDCNSYIKRMYNPSPLAVGRLTNANLKYSAVFHFR
jgi:hypothetical protein